VYVGAAGLKQRSELGVSMLRLHAEHASADPLSGPPALFAAAQAVETSLTRDFDLRMQGLVLEEAMSTDKRRGAFHALFAGFPVVIERRAPADHLREPTLGLVTFGSRPCTSTPDTPEQPGDNLFDVRTYLAESVDAPFSGYRIRCDAAFTEVRESREGEEVPPSVPEEIRRLYAMGCRHILLLAHRYRGRHIGGSMRYRLHDRDNTLAALTGSSPDLYIYPIVRDAFPATRMRLRDSSAEDAFEILAPDEHLSPGTLGEELHRDYTPVYSLATMYAVGEASRPQSGVCTYFLLRDSQPSSIEQAERLRANLLITNGAMSGLRGDLIALLRGLHYLEAERPPTRDGFVQPVLDPYSWLSPDSYGNAGEVVVRTSRRRAGAVLLSLPAVLEHVSRALHALPDSGRRSPTEMLNDAARAALWGDLFEVSVKRGCLALLDHRGLLPQSSRVRERWQGLVVDDLHQHLVAQSGVVDPLYRARQASSLDHLVWVGWALGWTTLREYAARSPRRAETGAGRSLPPDWSQLRTARPAPTSRA
jgi:hypothetical protein